MATEASPEYNLAKKKSMLGDKENWEVANSKGAGKSAVKDVAKATGTTGKNKS
jgi:hypothetical protein